MPNQHLFWLNQKGTWPGGLKLLLTEMPEAGTWIRGLCTLPPPVLDLCMPLLAEAELAEYFLPVAAAMEQFVH